MYDTIHSFIRKGREDYKVRQINLTDGLEFAMYDTLRRSEFYRNSRFFDSNTDSQGRRKHFYNIVKRLIINQKAAEDIDTKDAAIETDNQRYYVQSFLISKKNQTWMRKENIGTFFNDSIETRGTYGGVLIRKKETADSLKLEVVDWHQVTVDPLDIKNGFKIIMRYMTPKEIMDMVDNNKWDREAAEEAIENATEYENEDSENNISFTDVVPVYELEAILPTKMFDEEGKESGEYEYKLYYCITACSEYVKEEMEGEVSIEKEMGTILYKEEIEESNFDYLPYFKRSGGRSTLGIGVVEDAFESQANTNYVINTERVAMDLAGKVVLQSSSENAVKNVSQVDSGAILKHQEGRPYTAINLSPAGINNFGNMIERWRQQISDATSTQGINTGGDVPSNIPYRLGAILNNEANSIFVQMREEYCLWMQDIWYKWVIPFHIKQIKKGTDITIDLAPEEVQFVDEAASAWEGERVALEAYANGEFDDLAPEERMAAFEEYRLNAQEEYRTQLRRGKNKRTIAYPKDFFPDGIEYQFIIPFTNEQRMKAAYLESLSNVLTTYLANPQVRQDPVARRIFNQIMETSGLKPVQFDVIEATNSANQASNPQPQQVGGNGAGAIAQAAQASTSAPDEGAIQ